MYDRGEGGANTSEDSISADLARHAVDAERTRNFMLTSEIEQLKDRLKHKEAIISTLVRIDVCIYVYLCMCVCMYVC